MWTWPNECAGMERRNEYHFADTGNMVAGAERAARRAGGVSDKPTVGSLFAGIGGIDLAFEAAGFRTVWQVEIADFPRAILAKHFPRATQHRDIFDCHNLPHVDVITAGFPCQPFSLAGKRMGVKDERYLVPEMLRIIQEVQPYVVFLENVPGFASIADGDTFKQLLRALAEMGYDAQWGHLRAADAGAPHLRERWFCVAYAERPQRRASNPAECEVNAWQSSLSRWPKSPGRFKSSRHSLAYANSGRWPNGGTNWQRRYSSWIIRFDKINGQRGNNDTAAPMGNARRARRQKRHAAPVSIHNGYLARRRDAQRRTGQPQSRLGGNAHGLPARLDGHQFPAPPGVPQHPAEPPRVTTAAPNRNARLKALGNAVVPQVIYPVALVIYEWLAESCQEEAA